MTIAPLPPSTPLTDGLRLAPYAIARPALSSHLRPAIVLAEQETRELTTAVEAHSVHTGGRFAQSLIGAQLWDRPFDGHNGTAGSAVHLGTVDWMTDTPIRGYMTVYRAIVTEAGVAAGVTTEYVVRAVLELAGFALDPSQLTEPAPPPRDPFRSSASRLAS